MQNWMLPHVTSYWDERVDAIERLSRLIDATPEAERQAELTALMTAVGRHVAGLSNADLARFAVPVVEDLYKAIVPRTYLDDAVFDYLRASCGAFFTWLRQRGYVVQYFIDNSWPQLEGPVQVFPLWFGATSLLYICPQHIACTEFERDKPAEEWPALVKGHIDDARDVAKRLVDRCRDEGRHFVYLDGDAPEDGMRFVSERAEEPGTILIFRRDAPEPGSRCTVVMPREPRK